MLTSFVGLRNRRIHDPQAQECTVWLPLRVVFHEGVIART
jgi:hypothetical protein